MNQRTWLAIDRDSTVQRTVAHFVFAINVHNYAAVTRAEMCVRWRVL